MDTILMQVIGKIKTPHKTIENMPIQPIGAKGVEGKVVLQAQYQRGLTDVDGFSHVILVYHFHKVNGYQLMLEPFMDNKMHGVFATRSPKRPNAIGMSIVKVIRVEDNCLVFEGADMLDETPLLDIKPFFRQTDNRPDAISGWLDKKDNNLAEEMLSDKRFS